jgi:hypothetical protein
MRESKNKKVSSFIIIIRDETELLAKQEEAEKCITLIRRTVITNNSTKCCK